MLRVALGPLLCIFILPASAQTGSQTNPTSDPQAVIIAQKSIAAITGGGTAINDVILTGSVTWQGSDTGVATLKALGTGESRVDVLLPSGTRTEIRDSQTGTPRGRWSNPDDASGAIAFQNCQTDAAWFFPALGSLRGGPNVVLSNLGQETRDGATVQHIRAYQYQPNISATSISPQQLSVVDFYLDAATLLPLAETFNAHPDTDPMTNLFTEIDFSNYQGTNGVVIPMRIQKYQQGNQLLDMIVTGVSVNTGLSLSAFALN